MCNDARGIIVHTGFALPTTQSYFYVQVETQLDQEGYPAEQALERFNCLSSD